MMRLTLKAKVVLLALIPVVLFAVVLSGAAARVLQNLAAQEVEETRERLLQESLKEVASRPFSHLLCLDRATTGDGIVSALQVLVALRRSGQTLRQALQPLAKVPQKTVNVRYEGASKPAEAPAVQAALADAQAAVQGRGRAFLRPSGTEPVVRVTVEADDDTLMQSTLDQLADAVRAAAA